VAAPYQHGARVLAAMSEQQLDALRQRISGETKHGRTVAKEE